MLSQPGNPPVGYDLPGAAIRRKFHNEQSEGVRAYINACKGQQFSLIMIALTIIERRLKPAATTCGYSLRLLLYVEFKHFLKITQFNPQPQCLSIGNGLSEIDKSTNL